MAVTGAVYVDDYDPTDPNQWWTGTTTTSLPQKKALEAPPPPSVTPETRERAMGHHAMEETLRRALFQGCGHCGECTKTAEQALFFAAEPSFASTGLIQALRTETHDVSVALHTHSLVKSWEDANLTREQYIQFLTDNYFIFYVLEHYLDENANHPAVQDLPLNEISGRCEGIFKDLLLLHGMDPDSTEAQEWLEASFSSITSTMLKDSTGTESTAFSVDDEASVYLFPSLACIEALMRMEEQILENPAAVVGHAYVHYLGVLQGGQLALPATQKMLEGWGDTTEAVHFYRFPRDAEELKAETLAAIEGADISEEDISVITTAAKEAYEKLAAVFSEIMEEEMTVSYPFSTLLNERSTVVHSQNNDTKTL